MGCQSWGMGEGLPLVVKWGVMEKGGYEVGRNGELV